MFKSQILTSSRFSYLQAVFSGKSSRMVTDFLTSLGVWGHTGKSFTDRKVYRIGFKSSLGFWGGLNYSQFLENEGTIHFSQQFCLKSDLDQVSLINLLTSFGCKFLRVNIVCDDSSSYISSLQLQTSLNKNSSFLVDKFRAFEVNLRGGYVLGASYFSLSDKVLRFSQVQTAEGVFDRLELQLTDELAQVIVSQFSDDKDCLSSILLSSLSSLSDLGQVASLMAAVPV